MSSFAQGQHDALSKQGFELSMESYIVQYISDTDNIDRIKKGKNIFEEGQIPTSIDIEFLHETEFMVTPNPIQSDEFIIRYIDINNKPKVIKMIKL